VCRVECLFSFQLAPVPIYTAWWTEAHICEQLDQGCYVKQSSRDSNLQPITNRSDALTTMPHIYRFQNSSNKLSQLNTMNQMSRTKYYKWNNKLQEGWLSCPCNGWWGSCYGALEIVGLLLLLILLSPTERASVSAISLRHILASPGKIVLKVTWIKRGFDACQTHCSIYPSIFNRFPVIHPVSSKVRQFSTFWLPLGTPLGQSR